jgi:chromosome segregation ATPase
VSDDGISALMRVATRVAGGETLTTELLGEEGVPVTLRLVLAAAVLTAADRPVTKKSVTTVAPAARSATYRDHADLLNQVTTCLPALVQAQLALAGAQVSVAELAKQLQDAYRSVERERRRREEAERQLQHVASYARELHWRLKAEYDAIIREKAEKVRPLRSVPTDNGDPSST